ncbi:MAG TPA: hypothetical protein VE172_13015, partial [Stackebrandtia sp.]
LPLLFGAGDLTRDPGFAALDALPLPAWASHHPRDAASGSRWCLEHCRVRERQWRSDRDADATVRAYARALTTQGWRAARCGAATDVGTLHCYRRDEFAVDLWVRASDCGEAERVCPGSAVSALIRTGRAADLRAG